MSRLTQPLAVALPGGAATSGLLHAPPHPKACYVFAHGAGAGMGHAFMEAIAAGLGEREVATLRFQFPYMEQGSKRPDSAKVAQAAVRAAVQEAARRLPNVPLFAGGKSYGGRMSSQAQAEQALPGVRGLVFLGFPLHAAGKPSTERADHLARVQLPMLFLQGTRDTLADLELIRQVAGTLGDRATLHIDEGGDHSFKVLARSGRSDAQVREELVETIVGWMKKISGY